MYFLWYIVSKNSILLSYKYIVAFNEISNTNLLVAGIQWLLIIQVNWGYAITCYVLRSIESRNWNDMKPQLVQGLYDTRNANIWLRWDITVFHLCAEISYSDEIVYLNEWRKDTKDLRFLFIARSLLNSIATL